MKPLLAVLLLIAVSGCTCSPCTTSTPTTGVPKNKSQDSRTRTHATTLCSCILEPIADADLLTYESLAFWRIGNTPAYGFADDILLTFISGDLESPPNPIVEPKRLTMVVRDPNFSRDELFPGEAQENQIRGMPLIDDRHRY